MRRKIEEKLLEWKEKRRGETALLICGARRVGKSYTVEKFARENYKSYILVDFNRASEEIKRQFDAGLNDLDTLFVYLQSEYGTKLFERESLIIFDEIQLFPRARAALKFLVADGRFDYIETGSLISIRENVKDILIPSEEESITMYPMDFEEFLWAMGNEPMVDLIRNRYEKRLPVEGMHRRVMDYFKQYLIVGGMPQAVEKFVEVRDFDEVDRIKRGILELYRNDIRKYAGKNAQKVEEIFETIPSQLQHRWKRFTMTDIDEDARMREYAEAFYWLEDAGMVNIARNASEPNIGFRLTADDNFLKCYLSDTGLLISAAFDENDLPKQEIYRKLLHGKLTINEGMFFENVVAQMLRAAGHKLYYFTTNTAGASRMEIDFLLRKSPATSRHNVSPIEVKSGKNYSLTSLKKYVQKYSDYTGKAFVVHGEDLAVRKEKVELRDGRELVQEIEFLPVYMTGLVGW